MKIAISGTHNVGKTTLAEGLHEQLSGYVLNKEPYHELEGSGYIFSEIPDVDDYIKQFHYSVHQIQEGGNNTIFDRCPIDILAYIHAIEPNRNIEALFETAQTVLSTLDLLVFVPIEDPDLKSDLPKLRSKVNEILEDWIPDLNVNVMEVSGTISDRRDQLLKKLKTTW